MGKPQENHGKTTGKPWELAIYSDLIVENGGFMMVLWDIFSGNLLQFAIEAMAIEIMDLAIENCDFPQLC